jgi:hypothetical protein
MRRERVGQVVGKRPDAHVGIVEDERDGRWAESRHEACICAAEGGENGRAADDEEERQDGARTAVHFGRSHQLEHTYPEDRFLFVGVGGVDGETRVLVCMLGVLRT